MTRSYWDPANLLQITLDQNDTYGEIQCVGVARSRHNNRCRWTIEDPDRTRVRLSLIEMSKTKPESITTENLRKLAALCLCPSYHSGQVAEVVARWSRVVKTAVQHHKNLVEREGSSRINDESRFEIDLREAQQRFANLQKSLDDERISAKQQISSWREKYEKCNEEKMAQDSRVVMLRVTNQALEKRLEVEKSAAAQFAEECEAEKDAQGVTISELKLSNSKLEETIKMQLAHQEGVKQENDSLRIRLKGANVQLQTLQAENGQARNEVQRLEAEINEIQNEQVSSSENLGKLQLEFNESKETTQRLMAELEVKDRLLHQDRVDLEHEQSRVVELEETISSLQKLQADINQSREMDQKSKDEKSRADIEGKDRSLRQSQTELDQKKALINELEKKVMELEISESSLKESISACWLHGFCIWVTRHGKSSVSKRMEDVELNAV